MRKPSVDERCVHRPSTYVRAGQQAVEATGRLRRGRAQAHQPLHDPRPHAPHVLGAADAVPHVRRDGGHDPTASRVSGSSPASGETPRPSRPRRPRRPRDRAPGGPPARGSRSAIEPPAADRGQPTPERASRDRVPRDGAAHRPSATVPHSQRVIHRSPPAGTSRPIRGRAGPVDTAPIFPVARTTAGRLRAERPRWWPRTPPVDGAPSEPSWRGQTHTHTGEGNLRGRGIPKRRSRSR